MKEFKGTKEEWKSVYVPKTEFYTDRYEVQYGKDGECVAEFVHNEFDAKLIASAPELLEALQHGLRLAESLKNKDSIAVRMFIKSAKQAINKALGDD